MRYSPSHDSNLSLRWIFGVGGAFSIAMTLQGCGDDGGGGGGDGGGFSGYECSQVVACQDFTIYKTIPSSASDAAKQHLSDYHYFMKVCGLDVVAETVDDRQNMLRVAKTISRYMDADGDGEVDSPTARDFLAKRCGLTLLITHHKKTYKKFDDVSPNPYHQAFATTNDDDEPLKDRTILEELLHFQQVELWSKLFQKEFGLDSGVVEKEAKRALDSKAYVYDADCTSSPSCLQPEFFFCAVTTLWEGWPDPDSPSASEWTLKNEGKDRVREAFPDLVRMLVRMENAKEIPNAWPRVPAGEALEAGVKEA